MPVAGSARIVVSLVVAAWTAPAPSDLSARPPHGQSITADSLQSRALQRLREGSIETRRLALEDLAQATQLAPQRADLWCDLAQACLLTGQAARARSCLERATTLDPHDAKAQLQLGLAWKWDWLRSTEDSSLVRALKHLMQAAQLAPDAPEPRVEIVALVLVGTNTDLAVRAAQSAVDCAPDRAEPLLALACASYRSGALARADSAFRVVLPWLPADARGRFSSAMPNHAEPAVSGKSPTGRSILSSSLGDPDFTTPENEVALDFMSRVGHALLLFRD